MPDDSVRIMCPNLLCRKVLAVPQSARGKTVRCKACSTAIRIPEKAGSKKPDAKPGDAKSGDAKPGEAKPEKAA